MIKALYSASSGMVAQVHKQDVIANNIANAQTAGFKRDRTVAFSFQQTLDQRMARMLEKETPPYPDSPVQPVLVRTETAQDMTQGPIRESGNNCDFAIDGQGAFVVMDTNGREIATRAGNFTLNSNRELCTMDGSRVQGQNGAITIPAGDWEVAEDGTISVDGTGVDKIRILGEEPGKTRVLQGYLEGANFNIVQEMVSMIANMRSYEANQKVVRSVDETLERLMRVGQV